MKAETLRKKYKERGLPWLLNKCQQVVNEYIRLRDLDKPCISCCKPTQYKQAGHYYSVGEHPGLRFWPFNINGECVRCNYYSGDHLIKYRKNLVLKYGEERVKELDDKAQYYKRYGKKWDRSEVIEIIIIFKDKIKKLEC